MKTKPLIVYLFTFVMFSCGVKFSPVSTNATLPESFSDRSIYPSGVAAYSPEDLAGYILFVKENEKPLPIGRILPTNYSPVYVPIKSDQSLNYYDSKITKGAEANGSYLSFAASFTLDQMAELEMVDIGLVNVPIKGSAFKEISDQAVAWVRANPKTDAAAKRLWVKSVLLTSRKYTDYTKINANASGVVGDAVGGKAGVYHNSGTSIRSVVMGFEAFDIDELAKQVTTVVIAGDQPEALIKTAKEPLRFRGVIGKADDPKNQSHLQK